MANELSSFTTRLKAFSRVPDTTVLSSAQVTTAIESALARYNRDLPNKATVQITANGTDVYLLSDVVAGWGDGYTVCFLEYEDNAGNRIDVDSNDWQTYTASGGETLRLRRACSDDTAVHLTYILPHTLTDSGSSVRAVDLNPLAKLAAAECLIMYAAEASDSVSSSFSGDVVNYGGIPANLASRAERYEREWAAHVDAQNSDACGIFGEWDMTTKYGSMFWHGGRRF